MKQALQSAGVWEWGLIGLAVVTLWLLPGAWLLRWRVAREVRARPAFGAALWTVVYALALWAMLAIVALIAMQAAGAGGGWPLLAVAFVLSCLALAVQYQGRAITSVEGLATDGQQQFSDANFEYPADPSVTPTAVVAGWGELMMSTC